MTRIYADPAQTAAALIIFNGYSIAPLVTPYPLDYRRVVPSEIEPFKRLARYMARFKELRAGPNAWEPFKLYHDNTGLLGIALAPWLRGGANYLQHILTPLGHTIDAPETIPLRLWFEGIQPLADAYGSGQGKDVYDALQAVRAKWDWQYANMEDKRIVWLTDYYHEAIRAVSNVGFETDAQRIATMRKKALRK